MVRAWGWGLGIGLGVGVGVGAGAIPDETRKLIQAHAVNYMDEHLFYEDTNRLFLHRACKHGVL